MLRVCAQRKWAARGPARRRRRRARVCAPAGVCPGAHSRAHRREGDRRHAAQEFARPQALYPPQGLQGTGRLPTARRTPHALAAQPTPPGARRRAHAPRRPPRPVSALAASHHRMDFWFLSVAGSSARGAAAAAADLWRAHVDAGYAPARVHRPGCAHLRHHEQVSAPRSARTPGGPAESTGGGRSEVGGRTGPDKVGHRLTAATAPPTASPTL